MSNSKLPATFTSLYRLFLRTSSASVLHHRAATRKLRILWRPTFDVAATATRQLQSGSKNSTEQAQLRAWMRTWEQRMDTTLALLYSSCTSRGLPHDLTRNLGFLVLSEQQRLRDSRRPKAWQPHSVSNRKKSKKADPWETFDRTAWDSLSQVIKLAEGRDGVSLGRVVSTTIQTRRSR